MDEENSYLCGYLKIKGLTDEFPTLTTFFDGEIISKKYPFLTRKWDADEDVDRKHWVRVHFRLRKSLDGMSKFFRFFRANSNHFISTPRISIPIRSTTRPCKQAISFI